jgi:hypothetical protein
MTDDEIIKALNVLGGPYAVYVAALEETIKQRVELQAQRDEALEALRALARAADDVGVEFFDTEDPPPLVCKLAMTTEEARRVLAKLGGKP